MPDDDVQKPGRWSIRCPTDKVPLLTVFRSEGTGEVEVAIHKPCPSEPGEQEGILVEAIQKLRLHHAARAPQVVHFDLSKLLYDNGIRKTPHFEIDPHKGSD